MKTIFFALTLALLVLISASGAVFGLGEMVYSLLTDKRDFTHGFEIFSLSSILFLVAIGSYTLTKVMVNTEVIANSLAKFMLHEAAKGMRNPLQSFMNPTQAFTVDINDLDNPEKQKEFLGKIFGLGNIGSEGGKKYEQMTVEELKIEEKKAVDNQDFNLAAYIKTLIDQKKKPEN